MKKLLTITLLILLAGCTTQLGADKKVSDKINEVEIEKLKAIQSKILKTETVDECKEWKTEDKLVCNKTEKVKKYDYISDIKVPIKKIQHEGKELTEDLSKRTKNSMHFKIPKDEKLLGGETADEYVGVFYSGNPFAKDLSAKEDIWYQVETATTSIANYDKETATTTEKLGASGDSVYVGAGDGWVRNTGAVYATVRGASTGNDSGYTGTGEYMWDGKSGSNYYIDRYFFPVDLSSLGAIIVSAASFSGYVKASTFDQGDHFSVRIIQTSQASNTALTTSDYDAWTATAGSSDILANSTNFVNGSRTVIDLNATGLGWIEDSSGGWLKIGMIYAEDADAGTAPTGINAVRIAMSESSGTTKDPFITITYTEGGGARRIIMIN